ncbi:hypothetical protein HK105_206595 [Polyrhizophydium stewartii]|uniref:Uncharacterized protein n=1 Tax=Polyrhizophydium stewartii TaxID=2732419 RepID=A0ABR4N311_9FUNG
MAGLTTRVPRTAPRPRILKGNWYEEQLIVEEKLADFVERRRMPCPPPLPARDRPIAMQEHHKYPVMWVGINAHSMALNRPYVPHDAIARGAEPDAIERDAAPHGRRRDGNVHGGGAGGDACFGDRERRERDSCDDADGADAALRTHVDWTLADRQRHDASARRDAEWQTVRGTRLGEHRAHVQQHHHGHLHGHNQQHAHGHGNTHAHAHAHGHAHMRARAISRPGATAEAPFPARADPHGAQAHYLPLVRSIPVALVDSHSAVRLGDRVQLMLGDAALTFDMWTRTFVPVQGCEIPGLDEFQLFVATEPEMPASHAAHAARSAATSAGAVPLVRHVFEIAPCDGEEYPTPFLRIDTKFRLVTPKDSFEKQYAVKTTAVNTASLGSGSFTTAVLSLDTGSFSTAWQLAKRPGKMIAWEAQQTLLAYNTPVYIRHAATNTLLCAHDKKRQFLFGAAHSAIATLATSSAALGFEWRIVRV